MASFFKQIAINIGIGLDRFGNVLLLGDPNETISRRVARAKTAGSRGAIVMCRFLAFVTRSDHCANALTPGTSGKELWHWSPWLGEPDIEGDEP